MHLEAEAAEGPRSLPSAASAASLTIRASRSTTSTRRSSSRARPPRPRRASGRALVAPALSPQGTTGVGLGIYRADRRTYPEAGPEPAGSRSRVRRRSAWRCRHTSSLRRCRSSAGAPTAQPRRSRAVPAAARPVDLRRARSVLRRVRAEQGAASSQGPVRRPGRGAWRRGCYRLAPRATRAPPRPEPREYCAPGAGPGVREANGSKTALGSVASGAGWCGVWAQEARCPALRV
jgi:hypothetical protein